MIKNDNKKIAVLAIYDDNYAEMKKVTADKNIQRYCDLHGYTLVCLKIESSERDPQWYKIAKSIEVLKTNQFDWVFFIDLDCLIMNQTIKLETIVDENYSFIIPSHSVSAPDTATVTPFGTDNIITSQFLVKNNEFGVKILQDIWEAKESRHVDFKTFDYEMRQARITILKPEFKPHIKIIEEKILNRFWYVNSPFMIYHFLGMNDLVWQPGDFIVHVTGYKKEERVKLLSDLDFFSGGAIVNVIRTGNRITFRPLLDIPCLNIKVKGAEGNLIYETQLTNMKSKNSFFITLYSHTGGPIRLEGYDENNNLISLHKL